jgi:hypothetical protein
MKDAKAIKGETKQAIGDKAHGAPIDNVLIAMFYTERHSIDKERVKRVSEYLNGRVAGTLPSKLI